MGDSIRVYGTPIPEGSLKAFAFRRKNGKLGTSLVHQNPSLESWRESIADAYKQRGGKFYDKHVPVEFVTLTFRMPKPKSVKRLMPSVKPDLDKLIRGVLDALSDVAYVDDGQVVRFIEVKKIYSDLAEAGVEFELREVV